MVSQITGVSIVFLNRLLRPRSKNHQSSASLAFVRAIHRWPLNSPRKGPVTRKMFLFGDVIIFGENFRIWIKIALKLVLKGSIDNKSLVVQVMAWCHTCDKPLPEKMVPQFTLRWPHNDHYSVSNHQPHGCLLNRLFRRRWKKASKLRVTGLCVGNSPGPGNFPHKGPVTRKMFPFDDVIVTEACTYASPDLNV